jgi:hypothetical protein
MQAWEEATRQAQAQQAQGLTPERIRLAVEALPNKPLVYRDFEHGALWAERELRASTAAAPSTVLAA